MRRNRGQWMPNLAVAGTQDEGGAQEKCAGTEHVNELSLKKPAGLVVGAVCLLVGVSALVGAPLALLAFKPLWYLLGFEIVVLVAAAFGLLVAAGRHADGPGLALLCVAGAIAAASFFGNQSATNRDGPNFNLMAGPVLGYISHNKEHTVDRLIGGVTLYLVLRLAAAGVLAAGAAWVVLARRPQDSMPSLIKALGFGASLLVVLIGSWKLRAQTANLGAFATTMLGLLVGVVALGLLSAAVHFAIRAFEYGRIREGPGPRVTR